MPTFEAPSLWGLYLVSGDAHGLTAEEQAEAKALRDKHAARDACVVCSGDTFDGQWNGQECTMAEYIVFPREAFLDGRKAPVRLGDMLRHCNADPDKIRDDMEMQLLGQGDDAAVCAVCGEVDPWKLRERTPRVTECYFDAYGLAVNVTLRCATCGASYTVRMKVDEVTLNTERFMNPQYAADQLRARSGKAAQDA